jgi:hypothetical protein
VKGVIERLLLGEFEDSTAPKNAISFQQSPRSVAWGCVIEINLNAPWATFFRTGLPLLLRFLLLQGGKVLLLRRAAAALPDPEHSSASVWGQFGENIGLYETNATPLSPTTDPSQPLAKTGAYNANAVWLKCGESAT